ncbi:TBC1 domain family member 30 [Lepeophtheirus salmonis]|uniref:TBC1 domain family member 31 n=1 Tax=Lepeophtheirus salmonis TaxID=72036 RepID=A0A7R8HB73_LEPSM|nr:TBC1 domain family member 30 [Lepeophtheirus salmonis]CAF2987792.1 TBC1 domain family member 30 [Lepeophtheirus salmonis]
MWQDIFAVDSAFTNSSDRMAANPLYLKRRWQLLSRRRPHYGKRMELTRKKYLSLRVELLKRQFKLPSPDLLSLKNLSLNDTPQEDPVNERFVNNGSFRGVHQIFDGHSQAITRLTFGKSSSKSLLASSLDGNISTVQDLRVFQTQPSFLKPSLNDGIHSFDLSESDEVLIIAEENSLILRDSTSGKILRNISDISAFAVRFLPLNNNFFACLLRSGEVAVMNISTGKFASSSPVPGRPTSVALLGSLLWVANDSGGPINGMDAISWRGNSILLVNQRSESGKDFFICYRVVDDFGSIVPFKTFDSESRSKICSSIFAPQSGLIAAGAEDGSLVLYDLNRDGKAIVNQLHGHLEPVIAVAFSNDEAYMATADSSGQIIVWKNGKYLFKSSSKESFTLKNRMDKIPERRNARLSFSSNLPSYNYYPSNISADDMNEDEFEEIKLEDTQTDVPLRQKHQKCQIGDFYDDRDFDSALMEMDDEFNSGETHHFRKNSSLRKISDIGFYSDMDEEEYRIRKMSCATSVDEGFRSQKHSTASETLEPFRVRTPSLVDELLCEIYARFGDLEPRKDAEDEHSLNGSRNSETHSTESDGGTEYSTTSSVHTVRSSLHAEDKSLWLTMNKKPDKKNLLERYNGKNLVELRQDVKRMTLQMKYSMSQLTRQVKKRDRLRRRRERQYNLITAILQASSQKRSQDTKIRFSLDPSPGDPGYDQWKDAMKMVARLPEGIPVDFRKKLWLTLAEKYLSQRCVEWKKAERFCFNEWSNPDDDELGIQIVKDLHRTGCSLFCGDDAEVHQLMLKRVLLAYARWNKAIGYCQGFNMLGAIILEVMDKSESDALKVMIYMIEGVLPEDLLKLRLPRLSKHLDDLQLQAREGTSYEPPLTNVFTMQWFLTLFSTCLPRYTVLRVWDLILLEGNEVLLRTALAIWQDLEEQILPVTSADEFYSVMGQISSEMLLMEQKDSICLSRKSSGLLSVFYDHTQMFNPNLVGISPFPFTDVDELREKYTYNITPWSHGLAVAKRGLKILYSDDEDLLDEDDEKIAVAATFGISAVFGQKKHGASPLRQTLNGSPMMFNNTISSNYNKGPSGQNVDKDRLSVDISALRKQYSKLRQRQKQAHIILTFSIHCKSLVTRKKPLLGSKPRKGPPPGAVPAPRSPLFSGLSKQKKSPKATKCSRPQPDISDPKEMHTSCTKKENDTATTTTTQVTSLIDSDEEIVQNSVSTESTCDFVHKLLENFDKSDEELEKYEESTHTNHPKSEIQCQILKENSDTLDKILKQATVDTSDKLGFLNHNNQSNLSSSPTDSNQLRHFSVDFSSVKINEDALMRRTRSLGCEKMQNSLPKPFKPLSQPNKKNHAQYGGSPSSDSPSIGADSLLQANYNSNVFFPAGSRDNLKFLVATANLEAEIVKNERPKGIRYLEIPSVGHCRGEEPLSLRCSEDGNNVLVGCFSGSEDEDGELECSPLSRIKVKGHHLLEGRSYSSIVSATYFSGFLRIWDYTNGSLLGQVQDENKEVEYLCLSLNPFIDVTAVGLCNGNIKLYDENTLQVTSVLRRSSFASAVDGHNDKVFCIQNHPLNPNEFISAGWDETLQYWDARIPKAVRSIFGPFVCGEGLEFDSSGKEVLIANWRSEQSLQTIDYSTGKILTEFEPESQPYYLYSAKYVGKEHIITVGSDKSIVKVYDVNKALPVASITNLSNEIYDVCVQRKNLEKCMIAVQNQVLCIEFGK